MTETIQKVAEEHSVDEMQKRDGETSMAVGLFIFALGVPVTFATIYALNEETNHAAIVNFVCGMTLLLIGGAATAYGWKLFHAAHKKKD
jgi:hypothetical protein